MKGDIKSRRTRLPKSISRDTGLQRSNIIKDETSSHHVNNITLNGEGPLGF